MYRQPNISVYRSTIGDRSRTQESTGAVPSGGVVKELIAQGAILRNGAVETARRRKLVHGDIITIDGEDIYRVIRS